ncbi:MAG: 4-(cytidine 5'-diphospho)-2-C-methyl-D-erythritol kinase [Burkholderiaceae bacterium]
MHAQPSAASLSDLAAPAKLNLFLRVVGRRSDGYHLLQSLFVLLDWHDTLHQERRSDGRLRRHDLGLPLPADDLCLRAARLLQQHSGCAWGADISVNKVLPSGAGMGGGSSDAATVLLGLNRLWGLNWPRSRLLGLGLQLGADVPFFIGGRNAIVEGIGERLTPVAVRPRRYAVVKPPAGVMTAAIFGDPGLTRDSEPAILEGFLADGSVLDKLLDIDSGGGLSRALEGASAVPATAFRPVNDLQAVAVRHAPEIGQAVEWLEARLGNGQMTGSGSAVFARETAANAPLMATAQGDFFKELPAGWEARWCRSLSEHPLRAWAD